MFQTIVVAAGDCLKAVGTTRGPSSGATPNESGQPVDAVQRPGRIYIVDDEPAVCSALEMLVTSFGWECKAYDSAAAFLCDVAPRDGDCLLLDVHMPGMSGLDLQEALNARGTPLPTVLITAYKDDPLTSRALAAGAREVLGKPFDDGELYACLRRLTDPKD